MLTVVMSVVCSIIVALIGLCGQILIVTIQHKNQLEQLDKQHRNEISLVVLDKQLEALRSLLSIWTTVNQAWFLGDEETINAQSDCMIEWQKQNVLYISEPIRQGLIQLINDISNTPAFSKETMPQSLPLLAGAIKDWFYKVQKYQ